MTRPRTIDCHTHILTDETIGLLAKEAPWVSPKLTPIDDDFAVLEIAGTPYRPFPRGGWELERRFKDMAAAEVDVHVLSATPQTYLYDQDPAMTVATSVLQNDQIAKLVKAHPDRFTGIATLPMQAPERAAEELTRAVRQLGMHGAMIGSNIAGKNLDDPSFEPVWTAAEELDAFMIIHPANVAGADRLRSYYLQNLIGNPLDTTIAAACLVFGGVMERHPKLNVLLVHGGGFVPYQAGRWVHGWHVRPEPKVNVKQSPEPLINRFYYDTILHAKPQLEFLVASVGPTRVLMGSDYPYDMGTGECVRQVDALWIDDTEKAAILNGNVVKLLGL
ncbi:MAG: amidohydrolase [Xanthobacteraceae bacterium]|nr:amidohydrolase [Xanthobacteraceae bacterium]